MVTFILMKRLLRNILIIGLAVGLLLMSVIFIWVSTLEIPTLDGFNNRKITQSTKIYDRTGKILLFDLHEDIRRTIVPFSDISRNLKNATVAIEDSEFYEHRGVRPLRTLKAIFDNLTTGNLLGGQGGSTITQQVIKNTLLTRDKKISRKVKEWILAIKLERILTKDQILNLYLNEAPYGGNIYGVEEAAQRFFGVSASDVSLAQAAYIAALPQAPSRFSPYGNHMDLLEARKNQVLEQMLKKGFITEEAYTNARAEKVKFEEYGATNIKAPHFVFYVREYLEEKYGRRAVYEDGLKVITTLNYNLQKIGENVVSKFAYTNEKKFNAKNAALVAIDPKTGQILAMVGSRNYFDKEIDGKFNITTTHRQPGSTFKPIVYVTAFERGYTPSTVVFDVPTQFSTTCAVDNFTMENGCYAPENYDNKFRGPITLRNALAQSINIPAIKTIYLTGISNVLETAKKLGITSLNGNKAEYGLPLALGGGEVSPLQLTGAYSVFANDGVRHKITPILRVEDSSGKVLEEYKQGAGQQVITKQSARLINSVLTDKEARAPSYGRNSFSFGSQDVAVKTGTTNDFRDVWVMGYTPNIAVGTWGGNNDNSPIVKKVAGLVLAPMWSAFMEKALKIIKPENFIPPEPEVNIENLKPVLRGFWQGSATSTAPSVHSILYWVKKDDPRGPIPSNPESDPQYNAWEYGVRLWAAKNAPQILTNEQHSGITNYAQQNKTIQNSIFITNPKQNTTYNVGKVINISILIPSTLPLTSVMYYLNNTFMGGTNKKPFNFSIVPITTGVQTLRVVGQSRSAGTYEAQTTFTVK